MACSSVFQVSHSVFRRSSSPRSALSCGIALSQADQPSGVGNNGRQGVTSSLYLGAPIFFRKA
jgi:hypothetical protein